MNQKELTKTFMMILNWIKPFGLQGLYKKNSALQGQMPHNTWCILTVIIWMNNYAIEHNKNVLSFQQLKKNMAFLFTLRWELRH